MIKGKRLALDLLTLSASPVIYMTAHSGTPTLDEVFHDRSAKVVRNSAQNASRFASGFRITSRFTSDLRDGTASTINPGRFGKPLLQPTGLQAHTYTPINLKQDLDPSIYSSFHLGN